MTEKRFVAVYRCVKCKGVLSGHEISHSDGVCPYCGYDSGGTLVNCNKSVEEREIDTGLPVRIPRASRGQFADLSGSNAGCLILLAAAFAIGAML